MAPPLQERRLRKVRSILIASLVQSIEEARASQASVANWTGITVATVRRWLSGQSPIDVERVLASPRLSKAFREYLCVHDHSIDSAPYIAKKRRRAK